MNVPEAIQPFWGRFQAAIGYDPSSLFCEAFHFDDNEQSANELGRLVLDGTKKATAGLQWSYEAANKRLAKLGDLSVVTNWQGQPLCIIETTKVDVVPYEQVSESFAAIEGEGDGSLSYWREAHWAYFGRECRRIGRQPSPKMPVVCEQFRLIYPISA